MVHVRRIDDTSGVLGARRWNEEVIRAWQHKMASGFLTNYGVRSPRPRS
jgi:hypothetical protein